ncbi:MAG: transposase, partial [Synergistaceae bacterium]|nr:transposase [Synergistaceae bacterium]
IRLGKKWYGYFKSRNIEGKVKTVTVKRDAVGDIYVYLSCEIQNKPVEPRTGKSVGFDFGLKRFLTGSDGHNISSPYFFMLNAKQIKNKCRNLSHKQKGSHNRERSRKDLARTYRRMENQRKDFHFKTARILCKEYAVICLEDLNMKGMARRYGRKVHSLGFSEFVKILEYEAMKYGWGISHWRRTRKTCFGRQGSLRPESPAFRHGEYVKYSKLCRVSVVNTL